MGHFSVEIMRLPGQLSVEINSAVDVCAIGIIFLRPALGFSGFAQIGSKAGTYLHARLKTRLQPIYLQTISHIRVDCAGSDRLNACHS